MPMMMRGVPAPTAKGQAIMTDAAREGRYFGSPMGRIVDPFGEPIKKAYAFLPELRERGLLMPFVSEYLKAAWVEGVDVTREQGLSEVLQRAGCPADVAQPQSLSGAMKWSKIWPSCMSMTFGECQASGCQVEGDRLLPAGGKIVSGVCVRN